MTTIDKIYRDNLRLLAKEAGGQRQLAERLGKSPAQISQWLNASLDSKTKKPRSMSRATARAIEKKLGKPDGWMDQSHEEAPAPRPTGEAFTKPTEEDLELLRLFRSMDDEDQTELAEEIAKRAAQWKAKTEKIMARLGIPVVSSAPAKAASLIARVSVPVKPRK